LNRRLRIIISCPPFGPTSCVEWADTQKRRRVTALPCAFPAPNLRGDFFSSDWRIRGYSGGYHSEELSNPSQERAIDNQTEEVIFQLSLDLQVLEEAVEMAGLGVEAGIHAIEAGTILILSEGARRVIPRLKKLFPAHPIVADIKCMDGVGSRR
jgi:hypothetical protein